MTFAKVCINSGETLVDSDGNVLQDCVRVGRGWGTGFQEAWIRFDKYDPKAGMMTAWDSVRRYRSGEVLPIYMTY